jgi:hypothetical protein
MTTLGFERRHLLRPLATAGSRKNSTRSSRPPTPTDRCTIR